MYICLQSNSNIQFLPSNKRPSNIVFKSDPSLLPIPIIDGSNTILSNIEHTQTSYEHERGRAHLMMIELEHLNFCFEWKDIEHET